MAGHDLEGFTGSTRAFEESSAARFCNTPHNPRQKFFGASAPRRTSQTEPRQLWQPAQPKAPRHSPCQILPTSPSSRQESQHTSGFLRIDKTTPLPVSGEEQRSEERRV